MMNKDLYKQEVYKKLKTEKVSIQIDENKKEPIRYFKLVAIIVLCIGILSGSGYAGIVIYNNFKSEKKVPDRMVEGLDMRDNFLYLDWYPGNIYYKLISNYDEYTECKELWPQLSEMDTSEFEKYVLLLTITGSDAFNGFYITSITSDDNTMYIEFDVDENDNSNNDFMSTKIEKDLKRDNIEFKQIYHISEHDGFKKITEIPADYSIEDAITDGCFVIDNGEVLSNNKNQLEEFVLQTKNGKKDFIRIYQKSRTMDETEISCIIKEIEFDGEKYIVNSKKLKDVSVTKKPEVSKQNLYYNLKYRDILMRTNKAGNRVTVILLEEYGDQGIAISYNLD